MFWNKRSSDGLLVWTHVSYLCQNKAKNRDWASTQATWFIFFTPNFSSSLVIWYKFNLHQKKSMPGLFLKHPPLEKDWQKGHQTTSSCPSFCVVLLLNFFTLLFLNKKEEKSRHWKHLVTPCIRCRDIWVKKEKRAHWPKEPCLLHQGALS